MEKEKTYGLNVVMYMKVNKFMKIIIGNNNNNNKE